MNSKLEHTQAAPAADIAKYLLALLIVAAGIFAFYWFATWPGPVRGLVAVLGVVGGVAVAAFTGKGREAREFVSEATFELRKVVWPTQNEALRITGVILAVVVAVSLILALFDWTISLAVKWLLGN